MLRPRTFSLFSGITSIISRRQTTEERKSLFPIRKITISSGYWNGMKPRLTDQHITTIINDVGQVSGLSYLFLDLPSLLLFAFWSDFVYFSRLFDSENKKSTHM